MRLIAASTLDDYRRSGAYLIDLRTKEEYEQGHIPGALLLAIKHICNQLNPIAKKIFFSLLSS